MTEKTMWGIHMGAHHGALPIEEGFVSIGWAGMGDLSLIPNDREAFKKKIRQIYSSFQDGAIPLHAGVQYRFVYEIKPKDIVIYPSKTNRMVNIGEVTGSYQFVADAEGETTKDANGTEHRRPVKWLKHIPRAEFSQSALHEIGSALTLFQVSTHADEFLAALRGEAVSTPEEDDTQAEAAAELVEESTEDFVIKRLKNSISSERFEHFVAHLLRCMGYHARVTNYSGDGGIDIIAHRDELGFEPPVIKVQCKQIVANIGRPDVQQLMGAVEQQEFGLFVTLGGYTREAVDAERSRPNMRLIDGPTLVDLIFRHYDQFEPQWQAVVPLKRRYIPGTVKSND